MTMKTTPLAASLALGCLLLAPAFPAHAAEPDPQKVKAGARAASKTAPARAGAARPTPPPYPLEVRVLEPGASTPARGFRAAGGQELPLELELVNRGSASSFALAGLTLGLGVRMPQSVAVGPGQTVRVPLGLTPRDCRRHPRGFLQVAVRPTGLAALPVSTRVGVRCK